MKKILFYILAVSVLVAVILYFDNFIYKQHSQKSISLVKHMLNNGSGYEYRTCNLGNQKNIVIVNNIAPFLVKENKVFLIYTPYHNFEEAKTLLPYLVVDKSIDVVELHRICNLRD